MSARALVPLVLLALVAYSACGPSAEDRVREATAAADVALKRGALPDARRIAEEALSALQREPPSESGLALRLVHAETLIEQRDFVRAEAVLSTDLSQISTAPDHRARQLFLRARMAVLQGRLEAADELLAQARPVAPPDSGVLLDVKWLAAQIQFRRGQWEDGERAMRDVAIQAARDEDRYRQAQALNDVGMSRVSRDQFDSALPIFEEILGLPGIEDFSLYAKALTNASICYSNLGFFDRAVNAQVRAVELQRRRGVSPELANALGTLGNTYGFHGDFDQAASYVEQALEAARQTGATDRAALWARNLSLFYTRQGRWDEAQRLNDDSAGNLRADAHEDRLHWMLNAAAIAEGRGELAEAAHLYEEAATSAYAPAAVRWSAEAGRASVELARGDERRAARHFEKALDTVETTRSELLRTDYKLSFLTELIQFYRSYVDALVIQGRSERALEISDSSRGRVLAERQRVVAPARVTAATFQRVAARTKTTLLSYWLAPRRSFLWVITGTGIRRVDLPPAAEIEAAVREYRALVDNSMTNPIAKAGNAGDRLYQMLVAPAQIPRQASVLIVPDGALHSINFETLPVDGPSRHYWIEDVQVQVAPSLAMLTAEPSQKGDGRLLLIGNPTPRAPDFPALSYARDEMIGIVRHFPQERVTSKDGGNATPTVYREAPLDRFSMIHFTAHAVANVESPLDSAIVLSGPDTAYKLYARDVADQPLNADLVTVSACRSAGERAYSGEGLVGFAWAFLRAGARRVVAGLWDVDDKSTAQLMVSLYGGVAAGQPPAAALRAAKLELIKQGGQLARPYYWGPFQLYTVTP